jgi:hypothetical protein
MINSYMRKVRCSFLKKRTKKLFPMAYASGDSATARQKFFASFFQKRRFFLPYTGNSPAALTAAASALARCSGPYAIPSAWITSTSATPINPNTARK